jgi:hypothetical protein
MASPQVFEAIRRSPRIAKEVAILLIGSDLDGKIFAEQAKTVLLSRHGAGLVSQYILNPEQELIIRRMDTNKEAEVRIVGQIGCQFDKYTYGVAFLDDSANFWEVEFPPLTPSEKAARKAVMECSGCANHETVDYGDIAWDVYLVNEGIVRHCKRCQFPTVWKRVEGGTEEPPIPVKSEEEAKPAAPAPAAPPQNRRKRMRAKVSFKACIRNSSRNDIVDCEDVSRGGFRFKSNRRYEERSTIEVAVPYETGAPSIFVPAEIVYVLELPEQNVFRCGAAYSKTSEKPSEKL